MENHTSLTMNTKQMIAMKVRAPFIITVVVVFICIFLFLSLLMLITFFMSASLQEQARYVLFVYMLINDTINLLVSVLLFCLAILVYKVSVLTCYVLVAVASFTFQSTPITLAAMSLERFVAICLPLRHSEICRVERSRVAIMVLSVLSCLPYLIDVIILNCTVPQGIFFQRLTCTRQVLLFSSAQIILRSVVHASTVTIVALIIIFSYIQIMVEAQKVTGDKTSSSKASQTVKIHAVQLLLCISSFTYPIAEKYFRNVPFIGILNLFTFMLLPRFLSPLIYGLRDETFRNCVRRYLLHCTRHMS